MNEQRTKWFATTVAWSCLLLMASIASAGHYYESVTEERQAGKRRSEITKVKAWVDGDSARVEFASGEKKGPFADGNFLVTTDGGDNVYLVNPKDETYAAFSLEDMAAAMGQAMNAMEEMGGMMKMEFSDATGEKVLEEPGERILGHSTTHHRHQSGFTMKMSMMGIKRGNRYETVMDIWSTEALEARGFGVWLKPDRQAKTGNEGLDEVLNQGFDRIEGFPLKMVTQVTTINKKGKGKTTTSTMEVTVLREEAVADGQFEWPSHYTETEVFPQLEADKHQKKKGGLSSVFNRSNDDR